MVLLGAAAAFLGRHHHRDRDLAAGSGDRLLPRDTDRRLRPNLLGTRFSNPGFGVLPLVTATLWTTAIALAVCVPLGLGAAMYLSEYASARVQSAQADSRDPGRYPDRGLRLFALEYVNRVFLKDWVGLSIGTFSVLGAGLVMGIMIVPTVASLSEDAMSAVPLAMRQGLALGANWMQTT